MTRRHLLGAAGAASALLSIKPGWAQPSVKPMRNMGGAPAGFPIRTRAGHGGAKPFDFVEHCHNLGFGVVETRLPANNPESIKAFRQKVEAYNMRVILDVGYPRDEAGVAAFDASVKAAKECGAISLHAAMTGRRYEDFNAFDEFKRSFEQCQKSIALAEPVLRKYQVRLGIENHKGWRSAEQAAWMKRVGSEFVGVHFDFGNNVSLCEDPAETLGTFCRMCSLATSRTWPSSPTKMDSCSPKCRSAKAFSILREWWHPCATKDANMPLDLEMITRDPLKIPVFTDKYWVTFDDSYSPLPGRDLAHVLEIVRKNKPKSPLPRTTGMSPEAQLKLEDDNISKSIDYARQYL